MATVEKFFRNFFLKLVCRGRATYLDEIGHDQVPHEKSPLGQAVVIEHEVAHLAVHFSEGLSGRFRIIFRLAENITL
jgi:hypothetical protein